MQALVLDTNIYISAFIFAGKARKVLELAIENKADIYISEDILVEIKNVIHRKKFSLNNSYIHFILSEIEGITNLVYPDYRISDICRDRDDHIILECAEKAKADFIITGDQDLLVLETYLDIKIISPEDFLNKHNLIK